MKKFLCVLLVMILCSVGALATSTPSKEVGDMSWIEISAENPDGLVDPYIKPLFMEEVFEVIPTFEELDKIYDELTNFVDPSDEERIAISQADLDKLAAAATVEEYFGDVVDFENNPVELYEVMKSTEEEFDAAVQEVFEFVPVVAGGFGEGGFGNVKVNMLFPTPYEPEEDLAVMIGIVTITEDATTGEKVQTVEWKAFEGVAAAQVEVNDVAYGTVHAEFTEETVLDIQNGIALLAIVSMEAPVE